MVSSVFFLSEYVGPVCVQRLTPCVSGQCLLNGGLSSGCLLTATSQVCPESGNCAIPLLANM